MIKKFPDYKLPQKEGEDFIDSIMRHIKEGNIIEAVLSLKLFIIGMMNQKNINKNWDDLFQSAMVGVTKYFNSVDIRATTKDDFYHRLRWIIVDSLLVEMMYIDSQITFLHDEPSGAKLYRSYKSAHRNNVKLNEINPVSEKENIENIPELSYTPKTFDDTLDTIKTKLGSQFLADILYFYSRDNEDTETLKTIYDRYVRRRQDSPQTIFRKYEKKRYKNSYCTKSTDNAMQTLRRKLLGMARECLGEKN